MKPKQLRGGVGNSTPQGAFTPLLSLFQGKRLPKGDEQPHGHEKAMPLAHRRKLAKEMAAAFNESSASA